MDKIRLATRGSPLALAQAYETRTRLAQAHGFAEDMVEIVTFTTTGDRIKDRPLAEIGGKGLFTKELEEALYSGDVDIAVHSMKDMPAQLPAGLQLAAVLPREDPRDGFISLKHKSLAALPQGALLGSSSVRRTAQALNLRPDLKTTGFRGNVQTRLKKLENGEADATFLACAGLNRLGLSHLITAAMPIEDMLPAVSQGIIVIEAANSNTRALDLLAPINHADTQVAATCERAFLAALDGSCRTPIAGHAWLEGGRLNFRGHALTLDGTQVFEHSCSGGRDDAHAMGLAAAARVKALGGSLIAF